MKHRVNQKKGKRRKNEKKSFKCFAGIGYGDVAGSGMWCEERNW